MTNPYLQILALHKCFGSVLALDGVNLSVHRGSTIGVLGPNGAGKSTLFSCLLGFARPTNGSILISGRPLRHEHRRKFGYISERVALYPGRTVLENISFFAGLKGYGVSEVFRQLERVRLHTLAGLKVRQLSKGMLQRLGLAIALIGEPELLILDEPFNGLDPLLLDDVTAIIKEEQSRGATFLISTHTISAIAAVASHIAILLSGRLALVRSVNELDCGESGSLEQIYHDVARRGCCESNQEVCV